MIVPSTKQANLLMLLSIIGLMSFGLYLQHFEHLVPCPLCITQRFFYCLIGFFSLLPLIHQRGYKVYALLAAISALAGAATAGRQVWLQHLPPEQVPACGPSLQYMLETFPLSDTIRTMITGDGNCAEVVWSFLGLSMGEWSLAWFLGFTCFCLWLLLKKN
jgi:disulfide bond formation protein DsbB